MRVDRGKFLLFGLLATWCLLDVPRLQAGSAVFSRVWLYHPRTDVMSGAGFVLDDTVMAPLTNPAGTGGLYWETAPLLGKLHLPVPVMGGFSTDQGMFNPYRLFDNFTQSDLLAHDEFLTSEPDSTFALSRPLMFNLIVKHMQFTVFRSEDFAAIRGSENEPAGDPSQWQVRYRKSSGALGAVAIPISNFMQIGVSGGLLQLETGGRTFGSGAELASAGREQSLFDAGLSSFRGFFINAGLHYRPVMKKKQMTPAVSLVVRDVAGTRLRRQGSPSGSEPAYDTVYERIDGEVFFRPQSLALGVALSTPALWGTVFPQVSAGIHHTGGSGSSETEGAFGLEVDLGEPGDGAPLRFSLGADRQSRGAGITIDLGLIGLSAGVRTTSIRNHEVTRPGFLVFVDPVVIAGAKGKKRGGSSRKSFRNSNWVPRIFL